MREKRDCTVFTPLVYRDKTETKHDDAHRANLIGAPSWVPHHGMSSAESSRVLLMGARRAGKSSIQNVVFHRMSPHETLFLESTNRIIKHDISSSSFVQFEVWDFPGHVDTASAAINPEVTYGDCGALVWVIDASSDYYEALSRLQATIVVVHRINPTVVFEIFLHKVDLFTEDQRVECQREIQAMRWLRCSRPPPLGCNPVSMRLQPCVFRL